MIYKDYVNNIKLILFNKCLRNIIKFIETLQQTLLITNITCRCYSSSINKVNRPIDYSKTL